MTNIVDRFLLFTQQRPGVACSGVVMVGGTVIAAYWIAAYSVGWSAVRNGIALAILIGAYIFVCRHMSRQARTPENRQIDEHIESAIDEVVRKHRRGEALTLEDLAILRLRRLR